jgi:cytochrome c-type biogenesis protein CcmE
MSDRSGGLKKRYIAGGVIILVFIVIGGYSFLSTSVEYSTFTKAQNTNRKVQVNGKWVREREAVYEAKSNTFSFWMADDDNRIEKVLFQGPKPNNFDIATSVVVRGKFQNGVFVASELLTKCPSKYESREGRHPDSVRVR